ncbi:CHAT domain-containing protein [Reichenbachiella agarivorans]|uniref:CHAT domain-containing protein n=1 Tax=Reichenbachiella agarivorans TaxID=2979464 RepID=A0ABY6CL66_9BACT|nr:CHAT domain-containing tetratricopeptide repeat protein [Reichenbachiella agarivorans]UXP31262.1 CHAT domain-containing protein [Reichenbachiella agarivorans]
MFIDFRTWLIVLSISFLWVYPSQSQSISSADALFVQSKYDEAYQAYHAVAETYFSNNQLDEYVGCHLKMAECLISRGKVDAGIQSAESTIQFIHKNVSDTVTWTAHARMVVGNGYLHIGRNDLAIEQLLLAEPSLVDGTLELAECFENIGIAYWNNGNQYLALQYHEKALSIRNKQKAADVLLGDSNNNIGLVRLKDQPLQSIIYFNRALTFYESDLEANRRKIALCYANIAFASAELSNYQDALQYLDKMEAIWATIHQGDHANKAFVISSRGRIYEMKGEFDQALVYQQQALKMYLNLHGEKHPDVANTYFLIGQVYQEKSDYKMAAESYQQSIYANLFDQEEVDLYSLPVIENYYNADILLSSLQAKAKALEAYHFEKTLKLRDINGALSAYILCDQLINEIRQTRINEADKLRLSVIAADVNENGISISKYLSENTFRKKHYLELAFEFAERSKAAVLLSAINDTKAKHFAGIPDSELAIEDSLKTEIDYLEQMLLQEISDEDRLAFKEKLFDYQLSLREFVKELEINYPQYYSLKYNTELASVSELQAELQADQLVLSYFVGADKLYVFSISQNKYELLEVAKGEKFENKVLGMRNAIKYRMQDSFEPISSELYGLLIPKFSSQVKEITIFPDGILSTVPFESLVSETSPTTRYLIQDVAINYDYSATLYLQKRGSFINNGKALLIAPVAFSTSFGMSDLPATKEEVREIKYLFDGNQMGVETIVDDNANEMNFKKKLESGYKYLHLATHGVVDESNPSLSRIFLAPRGDEDGSLYCGEIYNLKINADLVSLSACETGLGKISKGEGVIGLSRALKYAGAQNLMVSLWTVNDQSTSDLMISFYKNHLIHSTSSGFTRDLQKAKLEMLNSEKYSMPYYWAPFVLVGK